MPQMTVVCWGCETTWNAAEIPARFDKIVDLLRDLKCPRCGAGSENIGLAEAGDQEPFEDRWDNA